MGATAVDAATSAEEAPLACPFCHTGMSRDRLARKLGGHVGIDLCFTCEGLWFDTFESAQLAPESVLRLFRLIHAHRHGQRQPLASSGRCPRCGEGLLASFDRCKSGRFTYHRCVQNHGRFIAFGQFMIEKGFVRQLNREEVKTLSARIGTVRCSGCGAPVDIQRDAACRHCHAPVAILDADAVKKALAEHGRGNPSAPASLADGIENAIDAGDIVLAGIELIGDVLGSAG